MGGTVTGALVNGLGDISNLSDRDLLVIVAFKLEEVERDIARLMPLAELFEAVNAAGDNGKPPSLLSVLGMLRGAGGS